ncbi:MAG: universal stress protein [Cyanobacteria bacterium P01_H01_bin.15]
MFNTILFPLDRSQESQSAAQLVANLVNHHESSLVLLSVVPEDAKTTGEFDAIAKMLEQAKDAFSQQNITAEIIERSGMPAFVICDVADEVSAELIVMGCRGLGLTQEGATDSVTNRVISLAPCPVLVAT